MNERPDNQAGESMTEQDVSDEPEVGPTTADLFAIEAEWPLIAAELAVVEAQCRFLGSPDVLARRALRRAVAGMTRAYAEVYGAPSQAHPLVVRPQEPLHEGVN